MLDTMHDYKILTVKSDYEKPRHVLHGLSEHAHVIMVELICREYVYEVLVVAVCNGYYLLLQPSDAAAPNLEED